MMAHRSPTSTPMIGPRLLVRADAVAAVPRYRLVLPVPPPIDPSEVRGRGLCQYKDPETDRHGGWYHRRADGTAVTQDGQLIVWAGAFEAADHCHISEPGTAPLDRP